MTVAELRVALADLPGNARVDLVYGYGPSTELVECEPVILLNRQGRGYVIITTEADLAAVEEEYDFIPRRKHSDC